MKVVPEGRSDALQFFNAMIPTWLANADAIGSNPIEMAAFQDKINAARAASDAQWAAQSAAVTATASFNAKVDQLREAASVIIKKIRAKAASDGNGIYDLAQIAAPQKPSPLAPPGEPNDFAFVVDGDGSIKLTWKCKNPRNASGTTYKIERRIGLVGEKRFTDSTVPAGASAIMYRITPMRSTALGPSGVFNINFGAGRVASRLDSIQLAKQRRMLAVA